MSMVHHKFLSPHFQTDGTPVWEVSAAFLALMDAREAEAPQSSHVTQPLEANTDTINAWASIVIPADPAVAGDKAAGDLVDPTNGEKISAQVIRWVRNGFIADLGIEITEHDAQSTFFLLDSEAQARHGGTNRFHDLTVVQQTAIVTDLMDGTLGAAEQARAQLTTRILHLSYWTNWPEHRVRRNPLGMGNTTLHELAKLDVDHLDGAPFQTTGGAPNPTQPEWQISSPNIPGSGTGFDYARWPYPLKKSVEDLHTLAFLEAEAQPAASETALATLSAESSARTLYLRDA